MKVFNLLLVVFLCASCTGNSQENKEKQKAQSDAITEELTRMNKAHVGAESKKIDAFIAEKKFTMQKSGTGLRYEIYLHMNGDSVYTHSQVELKYKIYLLDGKLCYSSDSSGTAKFKMGEGKQVSGLEEGIMMMRKGDKARLILPAHLAYGLSGDGKNIPPAQPVFFDIELINIKK